MTTLSRRRGCIIFSKGDYIEIDVFQTSGGALNLNTATLSLVRLPGATANAF
jgi:hypothetical protein